MGKNKIRAIAITAIICLAAGAGVFKVFISKADTSVSAKINVTDGDIKSNTDKNDDNKDNDTTKTTAETSESISSEKSDNKNTAQKTEDKKSADTTVISGTEKTSNTDTADNNEIVKNPKDEYLSKLAEIEKQDKACGLETAETTAEMNEAQNKRYKLWDDELNVIYSELKSQLSKEKMTALQKEEAAWIKQKEANAEKSAKKYEGGTLSAVDGTGSLVKDTRERCYYLVNNYM